MKKTYSFDIFDTCLVRKCGCPDNLFRLWADRALGEVDLSYLKELVNSRLNAEKMARKELGKEDVTLDDIYRHLCLESFPNLTIPILKQLELDVESENLSPVRHVLDLIRDYRKKSGRILFISDGVADDIEKGTLHKRLIKHQLTIVIVKIVFKNQTSLVCLVL